MRKDRGMLTQRNTGIILLWCMAIFLWSVSGVYSQNASDIQSLLSDDGQVLFGDEPNSVLVIDYPENIKRVEEYLSMVDTPPQQVLIEARVVEVQLTGEHALGINWQAFVQSSGFRLGQFQVATAVDQALQQQLPYKNTYYPPGSTDAADLEQPFTITIFDENINVVLQALANSLDTNILSAPRITTVNNRPANIRVVRDLPWAEPEVTTEEGVIVVTWEINFEEVGIVLEVTPTITEDGQISLEIQPEVSEKVDDYDLTVVYGTTEVPYTVPIIDRRTADTKVVIGNGQTLIIGGLIKDTVTKGITKVPLLGDIPILGWLFKSTKDTWDKTELLIFVSPTIITPKVMTNMEKYERHGPGKWYMEDRQKREEEAVENEAAKNKQVLSKLDSLEKKIKNLTDNRERLEATVLDIEE